MNHKVFDFDSDIYNYKFLVVESGKVKENQYGLGNWLHTHSRMTN